MDRLTISAAALNKILDHYRDAVIRKFGNGRLLTPATQEEMNRYLAQYQAMVTRRETYPGWAIALKLLFDPRTGGVDVAADENANIFIVP